MPAHTFGALLRSYTVRTRYGVDGMGRRRRFRQVWTCDGWRNQRYPAIVSGS
jgi:hypothetical protein